MAARERDGGCEQAWVGFWHCPSNPKKHFGVYKSRLSCAQRLGVPGREEGDADAPGHVLGSEQQAAIPAAAGTARAPAAPRAPPAAAGFQRYPNHLLMSAKLLHARYFSPAHLPLHLLHLSRSLTFSENNSLRDLRNPQIPVPTLPCAHAAQDP